MIVVGEPKDAEAALLLLHGRGATAEDILSLADHLPVGNMLAAAPQADGRQWYPDRFMVERERNEPYLSESLSVVESSFGELASVVGPERVAICGFSQGACLALEFAARQRRRIGGVCALAGGLVGAELPEYPGSLDGTPVFIGVGDRDHHIPVERSRESAAVMERLGANVTFRIYPGVPHTIVDDEIAWLSELLARLRAP